MAPSNSSCPSPSPSSSTSGIGWGLPSFLSAKPQSSEEPDIFDLLESGFAREGISNECLSPNNSGNWARCSFKKVYVENKFSCYEMFVEGGKKFLMSAKRMDGKFLISRYGASDCTHQQGDTNQSQCGRSCGSPCAEMVKTADGTGFTLFSSGCEHCDKNLGKFSCGQCTHPQNVKDHNVQAPYRQILAEIRHKTCLEPNTGAEMRDCTVEIPKLQGDKNRIVWCPRNPRGSFARRNSNSSTSSNDTHINSDSDNDEIESNSDTEVLRLETKLPKWNEELGSLVQRFEGNRVTLSSTKNFMMTAANSDDSLSRALQFGKMDKGKFILDYRYPIAPIQAFAIALSHFAWCG